MSTDPRFLPASPFTRLVRTHVASVIADAAFIVSMAGSLFFEGTTSGARSKVLLYLLLTMAPFAVLAPVIGPWIDRRRGGRRLLLVLACLVRALLCLAIARYITKPSPEGLLVYPLGFVALVASKSYSIAKSSIVPAVVADERDLVRANSRLAIVGSIGPIIGGAPAALLVWVFDARYSLVLGAVAYLVASFLGTKIPRTQTVATAADAALEREELHQPSILLAGSAMALLRGSVGFLTFFTAFEFRGDKIGLGAIAACAMAGGFLGNVIAPEVREHTREEVMLAAALVVAASAVGLGALMTGVPGFVVAVFALGVGAATGRLGFDSVLQRDGPDAARGRAFARFETRFQVVWVLGALLGLVPTAKTLGLFVLAVVLAFSGFSYLVTMRAIGRGQQVRPTLRPEVVDRAFDRARDEVAGVWRRRSARRKPKPDGGDPTPP